MLRHLPKFSYSGVSIILSNPARNDHSKLIDGVAGWFFDNECLRPETNRFCCDVRLIEDKSPIITDTKVIITLGQRALTLFTDASTTIDEQRGSHLMVNNIPVIPTFSPQDAIDIKDFESRLNPQAVFEIEEEDNEEEFTGKKSKTARSNYRFWLKADTKKALRILDNNGRIPEASIKPVYKIYPSSEEVIKVLTSTKGEDLYLDLETDIETADIRCFAFSFNSETSPRNLAIVYVVPVLDTEYKLAYENIPQIFRALSIAMRDNCSVCHNGSVFDYFILASKYRIPIGTKVFDSLVAQHRILPTVEKSLGHCVAYYTFEPYHKNEGVHEYRTHKQAEQLWQYCGKDVYTMMLVKYAQLKRADSIPGLRDSINQAMRSIRPYLTSTLLGMHYDEDKRQKWILESDRLMMQYMRIIQILCGPKVSPLISNKKCVEYFHELMGYKVVKKTAKGNKPSLAADALLKLATRNDNPVIKFLIKYRQKQKESGILNFKVWNEKAA